MTSWEQARRANLANWEERAGIHAGPRAYDLDGFAAKALMFTLQATLP